MGPRKSSEAEEIRYTEAEIRKLKGAFAEIVDIFPVPKVVKPLLEKGFHYIDENPAKAAEVLRRIHETIERHEKVVWKGA